ncbi:hypothetical protein [Insolitispirillum peregrinum]|uniref:Uncharacterized protein n=1 Tax=Insolitispirillum peregrinum TaxID=80876 RepID=A0A1N7LSX2_9PROT|nr:hypothetical protein [Insolitispirillum peregrinum]SIS76958.1 hypothetical protein SAMN05421779_103538 [Insolitispirillum peregrinum]
MADKMDFTPDLGDAAADILRPILRAKVGKRAGQIAPDMLQSVAGIGEARLKALKETGRGQPPTLGQWLHLVEQFGLDLLNPTLKLVGFEAKPTDDNTDHHQTNPYTALRALARRLDSLTARLEDGVFTPQERLDSARDLEELGRELTAYVQGWRASLGQ